MDIYWHTNDNALLAYIDLLGTRTLYEGMLEPLEKQAERLYMSLLAIFNTEFQNSFSEAEISNKFHVNIYADSIMLCSKSDTKSSIEKIINFILKFQRELIIGEIPDNTPIPFRAIIDRQPYFSIRIESPEEDSILASKYTTGSLCGGKGMVAMDQRLKNLPVGLYISERLKNDLKDELKERLVKVRGESLYFIKQEDRSIDFLFLPVVQNGIASSIKGKTLTEIMENLLSGKISHTLMERMWKQWIAAHEKKTCEIFRNSKTRDLWNIIRALIFIS